MIKVAFSNKYIYPLPDGHRFPISKYELVKEQLAYEGAVEESQFFDAGLCSCAEIVDAHCPDYWRRLQNQELTPVEIRRIGLPVTAVSVARASNTAAGTLQSAVIALETGIGLNIAGGTHHAYADRGEGFCILNDAAIAAKTLLSRELIKRALMLDLDVHQGNGTAAIFSGVENVFTFSMHAQDNFPHKKEKSDWDIPLPTGAGDNEYLPTLQEALDPLIDRSKPDIVFYNAGVDVLETDALGKLRMTKRGCRLRDEIVLSFCRRRDIPVVVVMGGGYSPRVGDIVEAHCNTFKTALEVYS